MEHASAAPLLPTAHERESVCARERCSGIRRLGLHANQDARKGCYMR